MGLALASKLSYSRPLTLVAFRSSEPDPRADKSLHEWGTAQKDVGIGRGMGRALPSRAFNHKSLSHVR